MSPQDRLIVAIDEATERGAEQLLERLALPLRSFGGDNAGVGEGQTDNRPDDKLGQQ